MVAYEEAKKQAQVCKKKIYIYILNVYPTFNVPVTILSCCLKVKVRVSMTPSPLTYMPSQNCKTKEFLPLMILLSTIIKACLMLSTVLTVTCNAISFFATAFWTFTLLNLQNLMCAPARLSQFDSRRLSMKKFPVVWNAEFFWIELLFMQSPEDKHTMRVSLLKSAMRFWHFQKRTIVTSINLVVLIGNRVHCQECANPRWVCYPFR